MLRWILSAYFTLAYGSPIALTTMAATTGTTVAVAGKSHLV